MTKSERLEILKAQQTVLKAVKMQPKWHLSYGSGWVVSTDRGIMIAQGTWVEMAAQLGKLE